MHVEDLILHKLSVSGVFQHVQRRLADSFGVDEHTASDVERLVKSYCLMTDPMQVLDELIESRQTLEEIAEELGVALATDFSRSQLIDEIVQRGLGFRPLNLTGISNYLAKIRTYQRRFLDPKRTVKRRSAGELRDAGVHCSAIIEHAIIDIFALHCKLLFGSLDTRQRERIRGVAGSGYKFGTVVEKLRNLDQKVLFEDKRLQRKLGDATGRGWIIRDTTLATGASVHRLRSTELAHDRKSASWSDTEPIVREIISQSLRFLDDVIRDRILPHMLLQVRSITDEWGRTLVMCLTEDDFDQDGKPKGTSERFEEGTQIKLDECLALDGRRNPFRPRVPCYCLPDDFSLPITQDVQLFFLDELRQFPSDAERGYE